jgi:hypothetical protein
VFTTLPQALQDQITKYREQSKTFIDAQRDLAKTLGTVTDEQRNAIREQLKANRDKFLTDTQQVRTEIRDQLKDLGVSVRENKPSGGGGLGGRATGSAPAFASTPGNVNTGGGGGGGLGGAPNAAGSGGPGIVIISYVGSQKATGGAISTVGGNTVHTFTSSGTFQVSSA